MRFDGKVALVTGGSKGIGHGIAKSLCAEGAKVIIVSRGEEVEGVARELGAGATGYRCDVSDPRQIEALFKSVDQTFGRLDCLVNNAGFGHPSHRLHELPLEHWNAVIATNVTGSFLVLKHAVPLMLERGGAILNMGSVGSFRPVATYGGYTVSKAAMVMLTKVAAMEYANDRIRVNTLCPGPIRTPLVERAGPEFEEQVAAHTLMKRMGTVDEVAALAAFLLSDEASFITGAHYLVDGGANNAT